MISRIRNSESSLFRPSGNFPAGFSIASSSLLLSWVEIISIPVRPARLSFNECLPSLEVGSKLRREFLSRVGWKYFEPVGKFRRSFQGWLEIHASGLLWLRQGCPYESLQCLALTGISSLFQHRASSYFQCASMVSKKFSRRGGKTSSLFLPLLLSGKALVCPGA